MNRKITALTTAGAFALVIAVGVPVLAHYGEDHSSDRVMAQTTEPGSRSSPEELRARLQERKDELKLRLSNAQKTRLQARCKNAQGKLSAVEGRIQGIETSRNEVYGNLVGHLTELSSKLKAKGIDTSQLDMQIVQLEERIAAFKTEFAEYKQAVADLAEMDCEADPEAFKAALEDARSHRKTLHETGQNIRKYVTETIKLTLAVLRAELAAKAGTNSNNDKAN